jgi:GTP:adenosylcobinamide-phosphate guanylyltransferase
MDAIILAGGKSNEKDPLYEMTAGGLKSLLSIAGKPMIQWVLDALAGADQIDTILVMGIKEKNGLSCSKDTSFLDDAGSLMENIKQGCAFLQKIHPDESHVMTISADIPAVTPIMIDDCVHRYQESHQDVCYSVIDRKVMEKKYPNSKRTYVRVKDGEVCGGDLNCLNKNIALNPDGLWTRLIDNRKNPLKQAALIGFDTLFLLSMGKLTLDDTAARVCRRLGISGKAFRLPYAEVGMDVDKPFQFEIVERDLMR